MASHGLNSTSKRQDENEPIAPVNKTISDSHQIRFEANKKADIKLAPNERKVGQYILGKSIGEGTFGKVKLGRHITTNEKVSKNSILPVLRVFLRCVSLTNTTGYLII